MPSTTTTLRADEAVVREIYLAHYGRLAGWSARLLGDVDLGHDVATEAFLRLLRHWDDVDEPRAWLYATASNQIKDHWRKRGREAAAYERFGATDDVAFDDPSTRLTVRDAVLALPERLRVSVLLHYFADLTVAQIAGQLGKSEGSVKKDLWEGRHKLAGILGDAR